jgi:hypothetical protein
MKSLRVIAAAFLVACAGNTLEPLALSISVTATPTSAAVGDTITFVTNAQGNALIAVDSDYGDGSAVDPVELPLARTAKNTFKHVYHAAGTFTATFTVAQVDSMARSTSATIQVH